MEHFYSSASLSLSPARARVPSPYFAPRARNICLASEWSLAVQIGAGRGAHCRPANDESVCPLSLLEETQAAASRSLTPLVRPGKQISKHMQYVFNPVEHFISQQTQITLRDIHILWQGGGRKKKKREGGREKKGIEQFSLWVHFFFSFPPKLVGTLVTQVNSLFVYGFANFCTKVPPGSKSYKVALSSGNSTWCTCCHSLFDSNNTCSLCAKPLKESEQIVADNIARAVCTWAPVNCWWLFKLQPKWAFCFFLFLSWGNSGFKRKMSPTPCISSLGLV